MSRSGNGVEAICLGDQCDTRNGTRKRYGIASGAGQLVAATFIAAIVASGCNKPPAVNPWRDDSIPACEYRSATSDVILSTNVPPAIRQRDLEPMDVPQVSYDVPHYPLWWEDPFEDQGDNNCTFAWTWQDYFTMPYGLGRFILNTTGAPVSMIVTPPCTPMVSDGIVGRVHDAKRGESPDPTAGPADFGIDCTVETQDVY